MQPSPMQITIVRELLADPKQAIFRWNDTDTSVRACPGFWAASYTSRPWDRDKIPHEEVRELLEGGILIPTGGDLHREDRYHYVVDVEARHEWVQILKVQVQLSQ